uniref:Uncharacterized protein n=1 Tax=Glossina pallidipes TaxID=7398 RepID=A0A1A9ZNQ7_GLOPL
MGFILFNHWILMLSFFYLLQFSSPTLHDLHDVINFANVDFKNFKYFKNLPSQNPKTASPANQFLEHFQKKKAILDYFENLFFGNSPFTPESEIPFDPHFGRKWRPHYAKCFGWRGYRLIDALGRGAFSASNYLH